jgi:hypothetical protein
MHKLEKKLNFKIQTFKSGWIDFFQPKNLNYLINFKPKNLNYLFNF